MRRTVVFVATVAASLAIAGPVGAETHHTTTTQRHPTTTTENHPTTTTPHHTSSPSGTVLKVTGTGPSANITIFYGEFGENEHQYNDVSLPWTETLRGTPSYVNIFAKDGSGSPTATISCEIDQPHKKPFKETSVARAYTDIGCIHL